MKGWNQRCALATRGDIRAAEVGDRGYPGPARDSCRITNLQRVRRNSVGLVADCLTVTAYGANIVCCDAALVQKFQGGITETLADLPIN
jgi:hypothetical protein